MSANPAQAAAVPLQVFGSWVTEMSPDALPEGVSPDNQEMIFVPGTTGARPALQKVFQSPFPSGGPGNLKPTVVYAKSFVTGTGDVKNLYLDSNGSLWVEDLSNPGSYTLIFSVTPGSFARSVTLNHREYIAISDGLHGSDIPIQYDGTYVDRISQDGPASPPSVTSVILPAVSMAVGTPPSPVAVTRAYTINPTQVGNPMHPTTVYMGIAVEVTSSSGFFVGQSFAITGNSNPSLDLSLSIYSIQGNFLYCYYYSSTYLNGTGGTATPTSGSTMIRANNQVTVTTAAAHNLKLGYQAQITGIPASAVGGGISQIVVDNENQPGLATIHTNSAHGLLPNNQINISGVTAASVGTITQLARAGQQSTVTMSAAHNLQIGSFVTIAPSANASFAGQWYVSGVPSSTTFTFSQVDADVAPVADAGSVSYVWPVANNDPALNYFTVQTAPTPTSFTVAFSYTDGTWTGGTITFGWNGTFYVASIPSSTSFTYQQYGPNANTSTVGTVTPYGQAAPGIHLCRVSFLTRQGQVTRPSPWVQFAASGGQYINVSNIAIGPSNIVARILEFTGASGSFFFYLAVPPQVNGQVVGTATQINDNTSTSVLLDFGDPSLYTGTATSAPTYNTAQQIVIDGALGFGVFKQRLIPFGQRNTVDNFLNLGFDGGDLPSTPNFPTGWDASGNIGGELAPGRIGQAWQIAYNPAGGQLGLITQSAYEDVFGAPILEENTQYTVRCWLAGTGSISLTLSSASTGFSTTVTFTNLSGWQEKTFAATPETIPIDLTLSVYGTLSSEQLATIDEISIFPADDPFLDNLLLGSYLSAPEQFNGVTGFFGPPDDTHKIMDCAVVRSTLNLWTQDPEGRRHEVYAGDTEPAGWDVEEIESACGMLSSFCLTKSQADDHTSSGGEEWVAWASQTGARIFGGGVSHRISSEIQSAWMDGMFQTWPQINMQAATTAWALNDPATRTIYFGLPLETATAPSIIYPLNYRELDSAEAIAAAAPVHQSFAGRLIAPDNARKWTRWNLTINGGALMYRTSGVLSTVFFGGNGQTYGEAAGFGNVYTMNPPKYTDDDYGQIAPYYVTCSLPTTDQEQMLQLDAARKLLCYLSWMASGVGNMTVTVLIDNLENPWPLTGVRVLSSNPGFDAEWGGGDAQGQRMFFKFASSPLAGQTDNTFLLRKVSPWFRKNRIAVRGAAQ